MSWIRLNDVAKGYDQKVMLREVFFRLADGDRIGLIGRNGTGKTTLLQLLLGREIPDSGTVDVTEVVADTCQDATGDLSPVVSTESASRVFVAT